MARQAPAPEARELLPDQAFDERILQISNDWLHARDIVRVVREYLRERLVNEWRQDTPHPWLISEFDVCGPVVMLAQQSLMTWVCAIPFFVMAYCWMEVPADSAHVRGFLQYPLWLWAMGIPAVLHICYVQDRCLHYLVLPQVYALGRGFKTFGMTLSFQAWRRQQALLAAGNVLDIVGQCLFFAQFVRSVQYDPQILLEWRRTVKESMLENLPSIEPVFQHLLGLFSFVWALMFLQVVVMIVHLCPIEEDGVSYQLGSMDKGYRTIASLLCHGGVAVEGEANGQRRFWHADVVRCLAAFGRMPGLVSEEAEFARLEQERQRQRYDVDQRYLRFLQIAHNRLYDRIVRLWLMDLLEKTVKLQLQVTLLSLDLALDGGQHDAASSQMAVACCLSFFSCLASFWAHARNLWRLLWLDLEPHRGAREYLQEKTVVRRAKFAYLFSVLLLFLGQGHALLKFVYVFFVCHGQWNINGCVDLIEA